MERSLGYARRTNERYVGRMEGTNGLGKEKGA